jgi:hypothetical protein
LSLTKSLNSYNWWKNKLTETWEQAWIGKFNGYPIQKLENALTSLRSANHVNLQFTYPLGLVSFPAVESGIPAHRDPNYSKIVQ